MMKIVWITSIILMHPVKVSQPVIGDSCRGRLWQSLVSPQSGRDYQLSEGFGQVNVGQGFQRGMLKCSSQPAYLC